MERIGDLVMALEAMRDVRALAPSAQIDLVVGSWNAALAGAVPGVDRVETLDARWLTREGDGLGPAALLRAARRWRARGYDLAINFEPDIRSNLVAAAAGAARTAGWASGGGGPLLDIALDYDPTAHTAANAQRLVQHVFGRTAPESSRPLLAIPDEATAAATALLRPVPGRHPRERRSIDQAVAAGTIRGGGGPAGRRQRRRDRGDGGARGSDARLGTADRARATARDRCLVS
jgi:ADP-heptose:LPS heptosyltransferase